MRVRSSLIPISTLKSCSITCIIQSTQKKLPRMADELFLLSIDAIFSHR